MTFSFSYETIFFCLADNSMPFTCDQGLETVLEKLERNLEMEMFWFEKKKHKIKY